MRDINEYWERAAIKDVRSHGGCPVWTFLEKGESSSDMDVRTLWYTRIRIFRN